MSFQSLLFRLLLTFFIQFPLTLEAGNILIPSDSIHSNNNLTDSVNLIAVTSTSAGNNDSIPSLGINDAPLNSFKESLYEDSIIYALPPKKRFWRALGEGVFVNTVVWSADRWILGKDYYSKGWSTLKDNWKKGWSWDGDAFSTNFIDHPYHGNLYFTGARSSGCDFWMSSLLTALGSVEWEEIAETDFPSHNDLLSTTFGGAALGEVTLRLSNIILNNRKRGFSRVLRETLAFGIAPMRGINRMIDGDMWRHDETHYLYHDKSEIPYSIFLSAGCRWADTKASSTTTNPSLNIRIDYGKFGSVKHNKPFDCFVSEMTFNKNTSHIPLVSKFCINGRLHGWQIHEGEKSGSVFSINQDFEYYNNEQQESFKGDRLTLLSLTEPAALGPAFSFESSAFRHVTNANIVFLGGYTSDYYYRDYNMGSGFNVKLNNALRISDFLYFNFDTSFHYMFTWKGYEKDLIRKYKSEGKEEPYELKGLFRKAGDQAYATFFIINPRIDIKIFKNLYASAQYHYFTRCSVYKYFDNAKSHYSDFNLSITYKIE